MKYLVKIAAFFILTSTLVGFTDISSDDLKTSYEFEEYTNSVIPNYALEPLYKFRRDENNVLGYDINNPVFFHRNSNEQIKIPVNYDFPKSEFRSMWVATIDNIHFPKVTSEEEFKSKYLEVLDTFDSYNMNSIIFQVRPLLDTYYESSLNPWSQFIGGIQGVNPNYDPLKFMIEETHKRSMEYHAWLNPYRVTNTKITSSKILEQLGITKEEALNLSIIEHIKKFNEAGILADTNFAVLHPEYVLRFDEKLFLNPGIPAVQDYLVATIKEIILNYDVDAIHFDDYFYPYKTTVAGKPLLFGDNNEDRETFIENGIPNGFEDTKAGIDDWRRNNIDALIIKIKSAIDNHNNVTGKAVQFGISPFGIWEHIDNDSRGSNTPTSSSQSYSESIFANTYKWIKEEMLDYVIPQIYWSFDQPAAPYGELVRWWNDVANDSKVQIYIGHANYKYVENGGFDDTWLKSDEIPNQIRFNQLYENILGSALFSYKEMLKTNTSLLPDNDRLKYEAKNNAIDILKNDYFKYKTLIPAKPWLSHQEVLAPINVSVNNNILTWEHENYAMIRNYVIYMGIGTIKEIISTPENIVDVVWNTGYNSYTLENIPDSYTVIITALDRAGVESEGTIALQ